MIPAETEDVRMQGLLRTEEINDDESNNGKEEEVLLTVEQSVPLLDH